MRRAKIVILRQRSAYLTNTPHSVSGCLPRGCSRDGSGFAPVLRKLINTHQWLSHTVPTMIIDGSRASVQWIAKIRHRPSGEVVETEAFDLWTFKDAKRVSLVEYIDTALANRLIELRTPSSVAINRS
jgi:ketosteroid isomerase-like protein